MSLVHVDFFSQSLARITNFYAVIPDDLPEVMKELNPHFKRPTRTLILLHGFSGSSSDWITGSPIRELSGKYNLAVVMPDGANSFYLDTERTGGAYGNYVGKELLDYARRLFSLSDKREDTYIGGYSMGGFGAVRNGLKYAEQYSKVIGLSNALIVSELKDMQEGVDNGMANYAYYKDTFGNLEEAENTDKNPEFLLKKRLEERKMIPEFFLACGTEDFLLEPNRKFINFMRQNGVEPVYLEDHGAHDWNFWNRCLEPALQWLVHGACGLKG